VTKTPQQIIDASPMSTLQVVAVVMCVLLNALDGFDVLSISFASPGIASEWQVDRAALGIVLSMELIGMSVGSLILGQIADRFGRRTTIIGCLLVMSSGMYAAAIADSVTELSAYRFYTGVGIGGMLAATNAMTAESANAKYRAMAVMMMAAGYPLGAIVGGSIASDLLATYDWRAVFYFGAAVSAAFLPLVLLLLPESVFYLAHARPAGAIDTINTTLTRMKHATIEMLPDLVETSRTSHRELFVPSLRKRTMLLTAAYFAHIMTFYFILKWIPKLVADMGYHPSEAGGVLVWANVGGLSGSVVLGFLSHRFGVKPLTLTVLVGAIIMVAYFGQGQTRLAELSLIAGAAGFFTNGAIVGLYALFAQAFPTNVRAGGTGFVIGVGRGGAALGPIVAGFMFALGYGLDSVAFLMSLGSVLSFAFLASLRLVPEAR